MKTKEFLSKGENFRLKIQIPFLIVFNRWNHLLRVSEIFGWKSVDFHPFWQNCQKWFSIFFAFDDHHPNDNGKLELDINLDFKRITILKQIKKISGIDFRKTMKLILISFRFHSKRYIFLGNERKHRHRRREGKYLPPKVHILFLRKEDSSASMISLTTARSWGSSVLDSMSRSINGTFMICWTGATNKSVNCSFLHLGSRLHHLNEKSSH